MLPRHKLKSSFKNESAFIKAIANKLLKTGTSNTYIQLLRYTFVGGVAYIIDFGTLAILTKVFKVEDSISITIAFLLGLVVNYILSVVWVFQKRTVKNKWLELGVFAIIGIIGLGINHLVILYFKQLLKVDVLIGKLVSTVFVYLFNFFARKLTLFR